MCPQSFAKLFTQQPVLRHLGSASAQPAVHRGYFLYVVSHALRQILCLAVQVVAASAGIAEPATASAMRRNPTIFIAPSFQFPLIDAKYVTWCRLLITPCFTCSKMVNVHLPKP
jgi:hypothetical protein